MLSVQRLKELFSTLRFRLVLWITLVVFLMVFITNIALREIEQRTLRHEYDSFLEESLKEVHGIFDTFSQRIDQQENPAVKEKIKETFYLVLKDKVRANEHRTWFLQLYNDKNQLLWSSINA